jgi:hypothetical protein
MLIDYSTSTRPTRNRLLAAMGISTPLVASSLALLGSLVEFSAGELMPGVEREDQLTVHIVRAERERHADITTGNTAVRALPQEQVQSSDIAEHQQRLASFDSSEPPADSQPMQDWQAIAGDAARASVDEYARQEKIKASMWRQSRSIMFQPGDELVVRNEEPLLLDVAFIQRSHVVGLGFNVGSCFIGIPIAGVPVEERTVGISVFVCRPNSG